MDFDIVPLAIYKVSKGDKIFYSMMIETDEYKNSSSNFYNLYVEKSKDDKIDVTILKHSPSEETISNGYKNYNGKFEVLKSTRKIITENKTDHCIEVFVEVACDYGYFHSDAECLSTGSHTYSNLICYGGSESDGGNGIIQSYEYGSGTSGSVLITPNFNYVVSCDSPEIDQFISENYFQSQNWANQNLGVFNWFANNMCFDNSQQNKGLMTWSINFLKENPSMQWERFHSLFIDDISIPLTQEYISDLNNPNIVRPTKRLKNNARINCIYNKAKSAPNFKQYLQNFDGRFSTAHLSIDLKQLPSNDANAETSPPNGYWINIVINSNNLNRPSLDIARTFMHEIIHAEMFRVLLSLASTSNGQIDVSELTTMLNSHNYPGIYDYFRRFGLNNMQHQQMSSHYISIMKNYLKQIDNSITDSQADAISWVGLQGTIAWNNLGATTQTNLLNIYNCWKNTATHNCP